MHKDDYCSIHTDLKIFGLGNLKGAIIIRKEVGSGYVAGALKFNQNSRLLRIYEGTPVDWKCLSTNTLIG